MDVPTLLNGTALFLLLVATMVAIFSIRFEFKIEDSRKRLDELKSKLDHGRENQIELSHFYRDLNYIFHLMKLDDRNVDTKWYQQIQLIFGVIQKQVGLKVTYPEMAGYDPEDYRYLDRYVGVPISQVDKFRDVLRDEVEKLKSEVAVLEGDLARRERIARVLLIVGQLTTAFVVGFGILATLAAK